MLNKSRKLWSVLAVAAMLQLPAAMNAQSAAAKKAQSGKGAAPSGMVDLNTASQADLEKLPGVGAATAKKIIAGRPYSSPSDLSKAGVNAKTIEKITPLVTAGGGAAGSTAKPAKTGKQAGPAAMASGAKVDLNTASQSELDSLPGVGAATAKKIIAGRPYSSPSDLSKAGVNAKTIEKITPLVTVSAGAARPAPTARTSATPSTPTPVPGVTPGRTAASTSQRSPATVAPGTPPPAKGMVWVNKETKVFHREGDRWYGNTKNGAWMTEQDAVRAGYRESKAK